MKMVYPFSSLFLPLLWLACFFFSSLYQEIFVYVNISNSHGRNIFLFVWPVSILLIAYLLLILFFFYAVLLARVLIYSLLVVRQTSQLQVLSSHHQSGGVWRINKCQVKCETFFSSPTYGHYYFLPVHSSDQYRPSCILCHFKILPTAPFGLLMR
jgi:hypothetical protein